MEHYNVNLDCLRSFFKHIPLEKRFLTLRQVSSQWKTMVDNLCAMQKELTLHIGSKHKWKKIVSVSKLCQPVNVFSLFECLTANRLTEELTTFLSNSFPRLESLAVVVDDQTEDVTFLDYLPQLISAFANTLNTLELVWNVKNDTFQAIFDQLITSIDGLHQLKRFSFVDSTKNLHILPFDLPHLFSTSLETLNLCSRGSFSGLACQWVDSLQARYDSKSASLMKINYFASSLGRFPFSLPANVAAQFNLVNVHLNSAANLKHLVNAFTNLKSLTLTFSSRDLSLVNVLVQLVRLPHLTELTLPGNLEKIDYPAKRRLPVLPAVCWLTFEFGDHDPVHNREEVKALRLGEVFPNVREIFLNLLTEKCRSCEWWLEVPERRRKPIQVAVGSEQLVEQCVTHMASLFACANAQPKVTISFKVSSRRRVMSFTADFDDDGRVKQLTKNIHAL